MLKRLIWVVACSLILVFGRSYLLDYSKLQDLRVKNETLQTQMGHLNQEIQRLKNEEQRLLTDSEYVERRARSKLKMSKEGEIILREE